MGTRFLRIGISVLVLATIALEGCTTYLPEPDALMAGGDEGRLADLRGGRKLYISKCSGCHSLIPVDRFDDARWASEVAEMVSLNKVRLGGEEQAQLLRYLTTASRRPR